MRAALCLLLLACAARAGELLVRVTFENDPIEGAGVAVVKKDAEIVFEPLAFEPAARTDEAGEAVVDVPDEGRVVVAMAGYALAVAPVERETVDVALRPERIFTGTVTDKDGKPVPGARVKLRTTFNREATFPAKTDAEGRFVVLGLWLDDYMLAIEAEGFLPTKFPELTEGDVEGAYSLERPGTIRGVATDRDGKPLAGVPLRVAREPVETGEDGSFDVAPVTPGRRWVEVQAPFGGESVAVDVPDGGEASVSPLVLRPAVLRFRAVDENEKPLDVTAFVSGREAEIRRDEEGRSLVDTEPGEAVVLRLAADGYESHAVQLDPVASKATHDLGTLALAPTAIVEVVVRRPDGTPAENGKVGSVALKEGAARVEQGVHVVSVEGFVDRLVEVDPPGPVFVTMPEPHWLAGIALSPEGEAAPNVVVRTGEAGVQTRTDAEGRFRIGPLPDGPVALYAGHPPWKEIRMDVAPGEGELVLRFEEETARLLRGRVLSGEGPVRRFSVNTKPFVDEEGRFERLVQPGDLIRIEVGERAFLFAPPPPGEDLVARLPAGRAHVTLEGGAAGREVRLLTATGEQSASATTDEGGIAEFDRLQLGVYVAGADGYRTAEVTAVEGEPPLVVLHPEPIGTLRVLLPGGKEETAMASLPGNIARIDRFDLYVAARVPPGEEVVVDLAPADAGSLVVRGGDAPFILERRFGRALVMYTMFQHIETLPPGRYALHADLLRREVVVAPGAAVEFDLRPGPHTVTGRVVLPDGAPAQGATVQLALRNPIWIGATVPVDPRGNFRFTGVPEGAYECFALLGGRRSSVARIVVGPEGVAADGLPLVVHPPSGAQARVLLPGGLPLESVGVWIDGLPATTDGLGWVALPGPEARLDVELEGLGSVRGLRVRDGQTVELARGADLIVLFGDVARERVAVRVDGRSWARLEPDPFPRREVPGRLRLDDLPAAMVEVEILPDPAAAPVPEEEAETPPPEPEITRVRLRPGMVTTVDLRD